MAVRQALILSDIHLGWVVCSTQHSRWLDRLPEAVDDAELIVLNGDVVDGHRRVHRADERRLVARLAELVARWRSEGRTVVYLEGNHDAHLPGTAALRPDRWFHAFETHAGERVHVLHGHRFAAEPFSPSAYERAGRRVLALENRAYGWVAGLRSIYRFGPGWLATAIGSAECRLERLRLPSRIGALLDGADVIVHGHIHFGPGCTRVGGTPFWRSAGWVSAGQPGAADRMLRYRSGRFERIAWSRGMWRALDDGR